MSVRITCIRKDGGDHYDKYTAIESVDWLNEETGNTGTNTRLEMYDWIKNKNGYAYVTSSDGSRAKVGTAETASGTKYIRTYSNGKWNDNLLALPECN
tara:strand:+ start:1172 stop:1465 length:294 start_codon:yes stop_codon:yes gene_type:complete